MFKLGKFLFSTKNNPLSSFMTIPFSNGIHEYLNEKGIVSPTPIQLMSIEHIGSGLSGNSSIFLGGPTGTGKTLAFALPIIDQLKKMERKIGNRACLPNRPLLIILSPSRELVTQTYSVFNELAHHCKLKIEKIESGSNWSRKVKYLSEGVDVLVTTINKLERLIKERKVFLSDLKYLVIDEADVFIESGEAEKLTSLSKKVSREEEAKVVQIFVSATLTPKLKTFLDTLFIGQTKLLLTNDLHTNLSHVSHFFVHIAENNRLLLLESEINKFQKNNRILIFCNSVSSVRAVDYFLKERIEGVTSLHSDLPVRLREEVHSQFKENKKRILISSDLSARGLDFENLNVVINFDFPKNANDYLHRAGRTGRAQKKGKVISLYSNKDIKLVEALQESYLRGTPLPLTQSSYSLTKEKHKEIQNENSSNKTIKGVPDKFIKHRSQQQSKLKSKFKIKSKINGKKPKNFLRKKAIDIKKSIKTQEKINPGSKRVKFLSRELKKIHLQKKYGPLKKNKSKNNS